MFKSPWIFTAALCGTFLACGTNTNLAAAIAGHHAAMQAKGGSGGGGAGSTHVSGGGGGFSMSQSHGASSFSSAAPHTSYYSGPSISSHTLSNSPSLNSHISGSPTWQGNGNWQGSGNGQGNGNGQGSGSWQGANHVTSSNNWQGHGNLDSRVGNVNHNWNNNNWNQGNGNWNHGNWEHNHQFCPVVVPFAVGFGWGWGYGDFYGDFGYPYAYPYSQSYNYADAPVIVDSAPVQANYLSDVPPQQQLAQDANGASPQFLTDARQAFKTGDYRQALRLANHAAVDAPRDARAHEAMSLALFSINDYRGAALEAHAAAALGPVSDWASLAAYYADTEAYTTQMRAMEKFVTENDASAEGHFLAGYHYLMTGYNDAARQQLEKALELMPKDEVAQQLLKKLGR